MCTSDVWYVDICGATHNYVSHSNILMYLDIEVELTMIGMYALMLTSMADVV